MKTKLVCLMALSIGSYGYSQTSVFSCQTNNPVTQSEVLTAPADYQKQCVIFDNQTYTFNGSFNKAVKATDRINIKPSVFHAGAFNSDGKMHLKIEKSPFDVFVMNYDDLNNVKKLEKLELGIQLPNPVSTYVNNFIAQQLDPDLEIDPTQIINPFLDWELDVEAIFHHKDGYVRVIDGFFTRDFERNDETNLWDDQNTPYPMRVRFAPPLNGEWRCSILVKMNGVEVATSEEFKFNVVESGSLGYVHVANNARNLKRKDRYIFPVGQNFPTPEQYVADYGEPGMTPETSHLCAKVNAWKAYLDKIEDYGEMGGEFIRTIQTPASSLIEFEKKGNYFNRLHYAWEQDNLLDICKEHDILVMFNLMHHYPMQMRGEMNLSMWDWDRWFEQTDSDPSDGIVPPYLKYDSTSAFVYCYNDNPGPNGKKAYEMFMNKDDLKYHEQRTRYYISRYGYSTQIYEFEIMSEPWHLDQKLLNSPTGQNSDGKEPYTSNDDPVLRENVIKAVGNYHKRIARYIKNTMGHYEHLIGANITNGVWDPDEDLIKPMDTSWTIDEIDVIGINVYNETPENLLNSNINKTRNDHINPGDENSLFRLVRFFATYGMNHEKPVIISEGGHPGMQSGCAGNRLEWLDNMTFGFTGVCGFNMWHLKDGSPSDRDLWEQQIKAKNHMNGDDVISTISNGFWRQCRGMEKKNPSDDKYIVETQMYISGDQTQAVGYVRNKTYNLATQNSNGCVLNIGSWTYQYRETVSWDSNPIVGNRMKATNLKDNTNYRVYWYRENSLIGMNCINSDFDGDVRLKFPDLTVDLWITDPSLETPVLWFVIKQEDCMNGLAQNNEIGEQEHSLLNDPEEGLSVGSEYSLGLNPNPVARTEELTITSPFNQEVVFSNSQGMKVKKFALSEGRNQLNLKDLDAGVYYLYFEGSNKMIKLVVL